MQPRAQTTIALFRAHLRQSMTTDRHARHPFQMAINDKVVEAECVRGKTTTLYLYK